MGKTENRLVCLALILAATVTALLAVLIARCVTGGAATRMEQETPPEIHPPVTETPPVWQRAQVEETVMYVGPIPYTPVVMPEDTYAPTVNAVSASPTLGENAENDLPLAFVWLGRYNIVGYDTCPQCCGSSSGITASGAVATVGRTVAVNGLPFGTRLYIDGIGERVVEDRGYLADGVIDVLCENHAECYAITGVYDVYIMEAAE